MNNISKLPEIVSNTGPLITLEKVPEAVSVLKMLYSRIFIPPEVLHELAEWQSISKEEYLIKNNIKDFVFVESVSLDESLAELELLHLGESMSISLAVKLNLSLLIEENEGRNIAKKNGVSVSGVVGQILIAESLQLITTTYAEELILKIVQKGRFPKKLYQKLLKIRLDSHK